MKTPTTVAALAIGLVVTIVLTRCVTTAIERAEDRRQERAALRRMNAYCAEVKTALERDAAELGAVELSLRAVAAARVRGVMALYTWRDAQLCVPRLTLRLGTCAEDDFHCLGELVHEAAMQIEPGDDDDVAMARLRERCLWVSTYVGYAASDIESKERRDEALDTFGSGVSFTSVPEITMCSAKPPDLGQLEQCRHARDYACMATMITSALYGLWVPGT
jgi:hypothetical protein